MWAPASAGAAPHQEVEPSQPARGLTVRGAVLPSSRLSVCCSFCSGVCPTQHSPNPMPQLSCTERGHSPPAAAGEGCIQARGHESAAGTRWPWGATGTLKLEVPSLRARLSTAPHSSSWQQAPEATRLTRIKWRWPREREVGLTRKLNDCNSPCSQTKKEKPYNNLSRYNVTKLTYS